MPFMDKVCCENGEPQISYFEVSPIDDAEVLQAMKDQAAAEMRARIQNAGKTRIRFAFEIFLSPHPGPVVTNRWEARADFYCARMESPQIGYFEVSTIDSAATFHAIKDRVVAKMKTENRKEVGKRTSFSPSAIFPSSVLAFKRMTVGKSARTSSESPVEST